MNGLKQNTHLYAAYKRLTSGIMTQRDWRRGTEKDMLLEWKYKESLGSYTYMRQSKTLKQKDSNKRQRIWHNDKGSTKIRNIYAPNIGTLKYIKIRY